MGMSNIGPMLKTALYGSYVVSAAIWSLVCLVTHNGAFFLLPVWVFLTAVAFMHHNSDKSGWKDSAILFAYCLAGLPLFLFLMVRDWMKSD